MWFFCEIYLISITNATRYLILLRYRPYDVWQYSGNIILILLRYATGPLLLDNTPVMWYYPFIRSMLLTDTCRHAIFRRCWPDVVCQHYGHVMMLLRYCHNIWKPIFRHSNDIWISRWHKNDISGCFGDWSNLFACVSLNDNFRFSYGAVLGIQQQFRGRG